MTKLEKMAADYANVKHGPINKVTGEQTWLAHNPYVFENRQVKMDAFVAGFKAARANIIAELNKSAKNGVNLFWALANLEEEDM